MHYLTKKTSSLLDSLAIALSGLCLVHCLALPAFLALFPLLGAALIDHETFHQLILIAVVPTTAIALGTGYVRHHSKRIALLGAVGITALGFAAFALHAFHAHAAETWMTVCGGLVLAAAHIMNFRRCGHHRHRAKLLTRNEQA